MTAVSQLGQLASALERVVTGYLDHLTVERGLAGNTISSYRRDLRRYTEFLATKRGLAPALHCGDPAYSALPGYFRQRLGPALGALLEAAKAKIKSGKPSPSPLPEGEDGAKRLVRVRRCSCARPNVRAPLA